MRFPRRIKLNKIKTFLKILPKKLSENSFSVFLGLVVFSLILGLLIFYQYVILAKTKTPVVTEKPLQFKTKTYQTILNEWQKRNEKFLEINLKEYSDPFRID